jgi:hypothetical protein
MRPKTPHLKASDTREERETKIRSFILASIGQPGATSIAMLARAPDSPVAKAVLALSGELAGRGIGAEILLAGAASAVEDETWSLVFSAGFAHEIRLTTNPRILDGHEQLVIGDRTVWYGDSMRRDPAKRDAFERFHHDDAEIARAARWTFSSLWRGAQPIYGAAAIASVSLSRVAAAIPPPATDPAVPGVPVAAVARALSQVALEGDEAGSVADTLGVWRPPTRH